ncbi:MAG: hypothetical protein KDB08_01175 [Microthrixaceae bacterium]|nr:hypothetical protein [Microthrixaceae bacterium]
MPDGETTSERRLRDAMERLLSGKAMRTDGRLIKENLYREAGVSRATMNRAVKILAEWSRRVDTAQPRDKEIEELKRQLTACRSDVRALRSQLQGLEAQLIIAATSVAERSSPW